ncbi:DeoR/GlpR family DNA-binding transcription regulator [Amycolatopsis albispora]|uniref:DeoR family transcriptional regulator n=1 Tax=Amycolatopsis albispora TaxID=1804986 RepID=A0A344LH18_9PSEU|nr:DeoR/GlpR family DNA-binding transcription regulator [Amycolatopsis albispora]AXB47342.1 DeoR family transcriptional regulator [Amycolatopsis albispora]
MSNEHPRSRSARQAMIADYVLKHGTATQADLVELTGVSHMTVHRDVDELARRGLLRKFRGGVSALPTSVFESNAEYRLNANTEEKSSMAAHLAKHLEPGMSLLLDDSTSALALVNLLAEVTPLTVATNYLRAIDALKKLDDVRLIGIGGDYSPTHDSFLGMACLEAIERLTVDMAVVSTSAMTTELTYHQEPEIVMVKRAMLASARQKVLLMDSSKAPKTALHRLAPVRDFDLVVFGPNSPMEVVAEVRGHTKAERAAWSNA